MVHNDLNFQYIKDNTKARAGKYFQRFELRDGDCFGDDFWTDCDTDRERVEFSTRPRQPITKNQCYGYSLMLSKDFIDIYPPSTTLGQVHQHGGPTGKAEGLASFPPLIQIDASGGYLFFNWHELSGSATNVKDESRKHILKRLKEMKEVWTDISFCLDFKNKRMDAWVDGIKKVEILKSPIFFKPEGIYFYGFGLIHMIGGLSRTATTALRQLLDAGTLSNLPAGFKQRGIRVRDEAQAIQPGEFRDVDAPGGNIKDAFMTLPFKEPSQTLLSLMGIVVQAGQRFAAIADMQVGDGNQQAAVGTTIALLERGSRVMSAIH